jgi:hypothetical protein
MHLANPKFTAPNAFWNTVQDIDISDRDQTKEFIDHINQTNLRLDCNYRGLHLFFGLSNIR